jgi:hypothetical protein
VRWFFVTVEGEPAAALKLAGLGLTAGFGSLPVRASIGATTWRTSVFPQRRAGMAAAAESRGAQKRGDR